ncbi:MAG: hypothetical protein DCE90_04800 [Pseudanabaena sp.]|nr:MAG: hypothetical protein DCE90_04800 [Pseudanabaena sp.]
MNGGEMRRHSSFGLRFCLNMQEVRVRAIHELPLLSPLAGFLYMSKLILSLGKINELRLNKKNL